ncbi:MAG: hypothetical protein NTV94_07175 [Planctomycetota bacterium]|nr:hypothetical protein [Planctomycetota bacterium]
MLPRHNLFDAVTLACLPDPLPRLRRALFKRLGSNTTDLQRLAVLFMWRPYSNFVPLAVMLVVFGGLVVLISWVLDQFPLRDAMRVSATVGFFMVVPPLWVSHRRLPIFLRQGGKVRRAGISSPPDPAEVRARRADWKQFPTSRHASSVEWVVYEASGAATLCTAVACLLMGVMEAVALVFRWSVVGSVPGFIPLLVFMVTLQLPAAAAVKRRLMRALEQSQCPACSYDLSTHPLAANGGAGPARCPECGTQWPLVPPPLFEMPGTDPDLSGGVPQLKVLKAKPGSRESLRPR